MNHHRRFSVIILFVAALCISLAVILGAQFQKPALPAVGTIPLVTARPAPAQRPSLSMHEAGQWTSGAGAATIKSMASSPTGHCVASGNSDGNVEIWEVAGGRLLRTLAAHLGPVMAIAFSPDGQYLASAGLDDRLIVWETRNWSMVWSIEAEQMGVISLAFSQTGRTLASGGVDGRIGLWDAQAGVLLEYLYGHQGPVTSLAYSSSGALLFSSSHDGTAWVRSAAAPHQILSVTNVQVSIVGLAITQDTQNMIVAGRDGATWSWSITDAPALSVGPARILSGYRKETSSLAVTQNWIAVATLDGVVGLFNEPAMTPAGTFAVPAGVTSMIFLAGDTPVLLTGGPDGFIRLWSSAPCPRCPSG